MMDIYQHDNAELFRFMLRGDLQGAAVSELEHAWDAAASVLKERDLVVDVSGVAEIDPAGVELLHRICESGARLRGPAPWIEAGGLPRTDAPRSCLALRFLGLIRGSAARSFGLLCRRAD